MPVQTPLPPNYLKNIESNNAQHRELNGNSGALHCRNIASAKGQLVTDDELRARGISEIQIDALDRKVETQKLSLNGRARVAVEAALAERNQGPDV